MKQVETALSDVTSRALSKANECYHRLHSLSARHRTRTCIVRHARRHDHRRTLMSLRFSIATFLILLASGCRARRIRHQPTPAALP